jgi:hypothetical protein
MKFIGWAISTVSPDQSFHIAQPLQSVFNLPLVDLLFATSDRFNHPIELSDRIPEFAYIFSAPPHGRHFQSAYSHIFIQLRQVFPQGLNLRDRAGGFEMKFPQRSKGGKE